MADDIVRSISFEEAVNLEFGDIIYLIGTYNYDGTTQRWRVNGKVKRWIRSPWRFEIPLKRGMYQYGYITDLNMHRYAAEEPPRVRL